MDQDLKSYVFAIDLFVNFILITTFWDGLEWGGRGVDGTGRDWRGQDGSVTFLSAQVL